MESRHFPVKEGQTMQSETDILYYAVYHRDYNGPSAKPSLLSLARQEYFTQGKAVSVREEHLDSGRKAVYRGKSVSYTHLWARPGAAERRLQHKCVQCCRYSAVFLVRPVQCSVLPCVILPRDMPDFSFVFMHGHYTICLLYTSRCV